MFEPGEKVVYIDDRFDPKLAKLFTALPKLDTVYVVRDTVMGQLPNLSMTTSVYLIGMQNPTNQCGIEHGFNPARFVPLDEYKRLKKQIKEHVLLK